MKNGCLSFAALVAIPLSSLAAEAVPGAPAAAPKATAVPQFSQEQIDALRQTLLARIAVWDPAEKSMRSPTPGETAALARPKPAITPTVVNLGNGGLAVHFGGGMSIAIAVRGRDGKVRIGHDAVPTDVNAQENPDAR